MASSKRRHKRASERLVRILQGNFDKISAVYISEFLALSVEGKGEDSPELVRAFEEQDNRWRKSTRILMAKNPGIIVDSRKDKILDRFQDFVTKIYNRANENEVDYSVKALGIERSQKNLAAVGISTSAKTEPGLQKRVNSLSESQLNEYKKLASV